MSERLPKPLAVEKLFRQCEEKKLPFSDTSELTPLDNYFGQDRAMEALRFGTGIDREGYNIYVLGSSGMGKHQMVSGFLEQFARDRPAPFDWCYVNNFEAPHQSRALKLPAGCGRQLQRDMEQFVEDLLVTIPSVFQSVEFKTQVSEISEEYREREQNAFGDLASRAAEEGVALLQTPTGYTLAPMSDGKVLTAEEFEALPEDEQERIQQAINELKGELKGIILKMPQWMKESRERFKKLQRSIIQNTVDQNFEELERGYQSLPEVAAYLEQVKQDVIDNVDAFRSDENTNLPDNLKSAVKAFPVYAVNVLVDNGEVAGAPVIYEDNPSLVNLIGRVEHESQFGALTTNFTLIKAGAMHRANGGYLLLDAIKVLTQPFAWETLKRALKSQELRIESIDQMLSLVSTKSLEPEPISLDLKVILMGDRLTYYLLQAYDPDFRLLFKIPADLSEDIDRTEDNCHSYARLIAALQQKDEIRPLDRGAVARVIEAGSRRLEDAEKLPLHLDGLRNLLYESDFFAAEDGQECIQRRHVQQAIDASLRRFDQYKERVHESILREIQLVDTEGETVAQINGLSVYQLGDHAFGRPSRITARARLGHGRVMDIERAVKMGGNIHSKGVMILSSFMASRFARDKPLPVSASLVFEQSYGGVEGDSASIAELCALISAIADVPIRQSLAVTGSVNQHGQVQAIGGVNQKIEGFFDICKARGLSGDQGVVIPASNVQHLMLEQRVVDAVAEGQFRIYAVETIDEALSLLTGVEAGDVDEAGNYPPDSVNGRVVSRIDQWIKLGKSFSAQAEGDKPRDGDDEQHH